jgi:chromosome segregation ATPase
MARTNLHELANRLLQRLDEASPDSKFEGKLREIASEAGLNSVRTAETVRLLEEAGRIEVLQRGRRGRDTIIEVRSTQPIALRDAEAMLQSRQGRRSSKFGYDDIGKAVVDRLLELARDDALRVAQVEAFAAEAQHLRERVGELESSVESANEREANLRMRLRAAEEALHRSEENLRKALGGDRRETRGEPVGDDDAQAVLDVLRSSRP